MENKKSEPFLEMPYAKRQLIVVVDDHVVEAERAARAPKTAADNKLDWADVFKKSLFYSAAPAIALGVEVVKAVRDKGVNVFPVSISESAAIQFPPGHPRDRVLYIGHPAIREIYYPAAQFHQLTFEHKFLEAIELLMALGAVKIKVEHQSGWEESSQRDSTYRNSSK